jgi:uncharacterized protein
MRLFVLIPTTAIPPIVIINEVDSDTNDTPPNDALEFVELLGTPNSTLDGLVLVFYNLNGDTVYRAIDLDGFSTDANGDFLVGNVGVVPMPSITFPPLTLQNGDDAAFQMALQSTQVRI